MVRAAVLGLPHIYADVQAAVEAAVAGRPVVLRADVQQLAQAWVQEMGVAIGNLRGLLELLPDDGNLTSREREVRDYLLALVGAN